MELHEEGTEMFQVHIHGRGGLGDPTAAALLCALSPLSPRIRRHRDALGGAKSAPGR
jgi:hypothetical protein